MKSDQAGSAVWSGVPELVLRVGRVIGEAVGSDTVSLSLSSLVHADVAGLEGIARGKSGNKVFRREKEGKTEGTRAGWTGREGTHIWT